MTANDAGMRFSLLAQCDEPLTAFERRGGFEVHGCNKHAFCRNSGGCDLFVTAEEAADNQHRRLLAARQSFVSDFQCTVAETQITASGSDFIADGCGRYARCSGRASISCVAEVKPSCQQVARSRFDQCATSAAAQGEGARKRRNFQPWMTSVTNSITGTIQANKASAQCESTYRLELDVCTKS